MKELFFMMKFWFLIVLYFEVMNKFVSWVCGYGFLCDMYLLIMKCD